MLFYRMYSKQRDDDGWFLNAVTVEKSRAFGKKTVAYMSCNNLLYKVVTSDSILSGNILNERIFVPNKELIEQYKGYKFNVKRILGRKRYERRDYV